MISRSKNLLTPQITHKDMFWSPDLNEPERAVIDVIVQLKKTAAGRCITAIYYKDHAHSAWNDRDPLGGFVDKSEDKVLDAEIKNELVENFDRFKILKHSTALPKAFAEKGLYMLATILKSSKATETTLAIIDTFAKVREIGRTVKNLTNLPEGSEKQKSLLHRAGELISDLIQPEEIIHSESEASVELNLAIVKFKYSSKKKGK